MFNFLIKLFAPKISVHVVSRDRTFETTGLNDLNIGKSTPNCPYCNVELEKFPGSKTRCKSCNNYMYVRTRPSDQSKIVVTEEETEKIKEQWAIATGTYDDYLIEKRNYEEARNTLLKRFGTEPSKNDIRWLLCNKEKIEHIRKNNWGLYRNTVFEMADILRKERKFSEALSLFLRVLYIDLNGPLNNEGGTERFNPHEPDSFIAPGLVDLITKMMKVLELSEQELENRFRDEANNIHDTLKTPVSAEHAWKTLKNKCAFKD